MALYASDDFSGTFSDWDDADVGGHWGYSDGPSGFTKAGGFGLLTFSGESAPRAVLYEATPSADHKVAVKVRSSTVTGSLVYVYGRVGIDSGAPDSIVEDAYAAVLFFEGNGNLNCSLRKFTNGSDGALSSGGGFTSTGLTYSADEDIWIELLIDGTTIEGRYWKDSGGSRPGSAQVSGSDSDFSSGRYGLNVYNSSGTAKVISFSDFTAESLTEDVTLTPDPVPVSLDVAAPSLGLTLGLGSGNVILDLSSVTDVLGLSLSLDSGNPILDLSSFSGDVVSSVFTVTLSPVVLDLGALSDTMVVDLILASGSVGLDLGVTSVGQIGPQAIVSGSDHEIIEDAITFYEAYDVADEATKRSLLRDWLLSHGGVLRMDQDGFLYIKGGLLPSRYEGSD